MRARFLGGLAVAVLLVGGVVAGVTSSSKPHHPRAPAGSLVERASAYLGVDAEALRRQIQAGRSPAQVAEATRGKSAAGLIESLLARRQAGRARRTDRPTRDRTRARQRR